MAEYPDDDQFDRLVHAATAAASEQRHRKRRRVDDDDDDSIIDPSLSADGVHSNLHHSAAVLFREPSQKSKKYSRPPLGKVYASLELAPENFLKLQSAAKDFMLHPDHPERRDVVGHKRHSGGTDVAKLKLYNCVEQFLRDEGSGEKFFGEGAGQGVPGAPERTMQWPDDAPRIIRSCMPLMRKMVTNERQRLYAAESRKPRLEGEEEPHRPQEGQFDESIMGTEHPQENGTDNVQDTTAQEPPRIPPQILSSGSVVLLVNLMTLSANNSLHRILPRFSIPPESAPNLLALREQIKSRTKNISSKKIDNATIKVWMSDGLVQVKDDGEWMVALLSVGLVEWMDGDVRVIIEV